MTSVPTEFQYFDAKNVGGADSAADYCPYVISVELGDCRVAALQEYAIFGYGEKYGPQSRCIEGRLAPSGYIPVQYTGCFETTCETGKIVVSIGGTDIDCLAAEEGAEKTIPGMEGTFTCPDYNRLCNNAIITCIGSCFGHGSCGGHAGCVCDETWFGDDCNSQCHVNCLTCDGPDANDCLTCKSDATLDNTTGECSCDGTG
jgi:hypothetical protein